MIIAYVVGGITPKEKKPSRIKAAFHSLFSKKEVVVVKEDRRICNNELPESLDMSIAKQYVWQSTKVYAGGTIRIVCNRFSFDWIVNDISVSSMEDAMFFTNPTDEQVVVLQDIEAAIKPYREWAESVGIVEKIISENTIHFKMINLKVSNVKPGTYLIGRGVSILVSPAVGGTIAITKGFVDGYLPFDLMDSEEMSAFLRIVSFKDGVSSNFVNFQNDISRHQLVVEAGLITKNGEIDGLVESRISPEGIHLIKNIKVEKYNVYKALV